MYMIVMRKCSMRLRKKCGVVVVTAVVGETYPYTDWISFSQRSENKSNKLQLPIKHSLRSNQKTTLGSNS